MGKHTNISPTDTCLMELQGEASLALELARALAPRGVAELQLALILARLGGYHREVLDHFKVRRQQERYHRRDAHLVFPLHPDTAYSYA